MVKDILSAYNYNKPFHTFFTDLSKQHKNWGSKDRKIYKSLVYAYFRLGHSVEKMPLEEAIQLAWDCIQDPKNLPKAEKIFPLKKMVSTDIDFNNWAKELWLQKPLYLSVRKGMMDTTKKYLETANIPYEELSTIALKLPSDSKCDELIQLGYAWVMDLASQELAAHVSIERGEKVWDACSGSGGKSLYLRNVNNFEFALTCSDIRFSILENLKKRFHLYGFKLPHIELSDLTSGFQLNEKFDKIILDIPCTGSGTWGRSPEQIKSMNQEKLERYTKLQRSIFDKVVSHLKPGGKLYYMTCSVFKGENEDIVNHYLTGFNLTLVSSNYIHYPESDCLYIAELQSN